MHYSIEEKVPKKYMISWCNFLKSIFIFARVVRVRKLLVKAPGPVGLVDEVR